MPQSTAYETCLSFQYQLFLVKPSVTSKEQSFCDSGVIPPGGGRSHGLGCVGIGPISGFIAPDEKYLPGRGVATWVASPDGCVDYKRGLQAWIDPGLMCGILWLRQR